jgi:hypothetical protein
MGISVVLWIGGLFAFFLIVIGALKRFARDADDNKKKEGNRWITVGLAAGSVVFGLVLLRFCFTVIIGAPEMPDRAYQIVRLVIGMGAGFVAAGLAGPFEIETGWPTATIKAGGPTGVAIFFYLVNPMEFDA